MWWSLYLAHSLMWPLTALLVAALAAILVYLGPKGIGQLLDALRGVVNLLRLLVFARRFQARARRLGVGWSFVDSIIEVVAKAPSAAALTHVDTDATLTYNELDLLSDRVALWLRKKGVHEGDCVALFLPNCVLYVVLWMGCLKAGATAALLHSNLQGSSLKHAVEMALEHTAPSRRFLIFAASLARPLRSAGVVDAVEGLRLRCLFDQTLEDEKDEDKGEEDLRLAEAIDPMFVSCSSAWEHTVRRGSMQVDANAREVADALPVDLPFDAAERKEVRRQLREARMDQGIQWSSIALLIFTSGTTGLPKASKIHHLRLFLAGKVLGILTELHGTDVLYCPLPLSHSGGGMMGVVGALAAGCRFVTRTKFSVRRFSKDCLTYNVTVVQYIGELARYLTIASTKDDEPVHLRAAIGNGLRPDVWPVFKDKYQIRLIVEFYAATEGNANMMNNTNKVGAIGFVPFFVRPVYPVKLFKFDAEKEELVRHPRTGLCIAAAPGEPGHLLGRIDMKDAIRRFDGYTDGAATKKKIIRDVVRKGDQWFASGDLLSADRLGFYYWVDRIGDTFRWKGENTSTAEVASVMTRCPEPNTVIDANVYGIEIPHCDGRAGCARIILACSHTIFDFGALHRHLSANLQASAIPVFLRISKTQETYEEHMTSTFKHKKTQLKAEGFSVSVAAKAEDVVYIRDGVHQTYRSFTPEDETLVRTGKLLL